MMLRTLLLAFLLLGSGGYSADQGTDDRTLLEGKWTLHTFEVDGAKVSITDFQAGTIQEAKLVIQGDQYVFSLGKDKVIFRHKLNPAVTPKEIDLTVYSGPAIGKMSYGIYRLEADTYTVCRNVEPEKPRPREFATSPKSGLMLLVWKRAKP